MRPPVAAAEGNSPLRGSRAKRVFELSSGKYKDKNGFNITQEQLVAQYTDDARLADTNWNKRHHITPSEFNG